MKSILIIGLIQLFFTLSLGVVVDLSPTKDTWTSVSCSSGCETHGSESLLRSAHVRPFGPHYTDFVTWTAWNLNSLTGFNVISAHALYTIGCFDGSSCADLNSRATCEGNNHTAYNTTNGWNQNTLTNSNCIGMTCQNVPANIVAVASGSVSGGILSLDLTQVVKYRLSGATKTLSINIYETDASLASYYSVFCSQNAESNQPILRVNLLN